MSRSLLLMICILTGLLVLACAKPPDTNRNAEATTSTSPAPAGTPATTSSASTAEKVGIAECDNFITAYEECVSSKVPEAARVELRKAVTTWRTEWKKLADNPQTRGSLAAACKRQQEATATQMKAYNCKF